MTELSPISIAEGKKIFFASDFHLGIPGINSSLEREKKVVAWLDSIKSQAQEIFLVGDLFDFWFEYGRVVPKGFTRLLGKIAEIADSGIPIHLFTGNHDMWIFDYLPSDLGVKLYREPLRRKINGKVFMIGHGDGLGPGDRGYKFIKRVFRSRLCQFLFRWIHPDLGIALADYWSRKSRNSTHTDEAVFMGEDREWLVVFAREQLVSQKIDYFIFGHRHIPLDITIDGNARYINLGDWISHFTFADFNGSGLVLDKFKG